MTLVGEECLSARCIPDLNQRGIASRAIVTASGNHKFAIGRPGYRFHHACVPVIDPDRFVTIRLPELHRMLVRIACWCVMISPTARSDNLSIRRPSDGSDGIWMSMINEAGPSSSNLPDMHSARTVRITISRSDQFPAGDQVRELIVEVWP